MILPNRKDSFDENGVQVLISLVDKIIEENASENIPGSDEFLISGRCLNSLLKAAASYCEGVKDFVREHISVYICLCDVLAFQAQFKESLEVSRKALEVANKSMVNEYIAESTMYCANAAISCALALASTLVEKAENGGEIHVPEEVENEAVELIDTVIDYTHDAYLMYLKIAIEGAAKLGLVDAILIDKLDDDSILDTVGILSNALEEAGQKDEIVPIIDSLNLAVEMNEKVGLREGFDCSAVILTVLV